MIQLIERSRKAADEHVDTHSEDISWYVKGFFEQNIHSSVQDIQPYISEIHV
jgi:hypothetical protein